MKKTTHLLVLAGCLVFGACESVGTKETIGSGAGAIVGGIIGDRLGNSRASALIGAAVGTFIGNRIGNYLDNQDKEKLAEATVAVAETGGTETWENEKSGNSGSATVVAQSEVDGQMCRDIEQSVALDSGELVKERVTACKGPNGWTVV